MIGKIVFKYGMAKIAPKVIATLATSAGVGGITVICHKINCKTSYQYDKKAKDDTQNRIINGYNSLNESRESIT